jgi:hypothetical protein
LDPNDLEKSESDIGMFDYKWDHYLCGSGHFEFSKVRGYIANAISIHRNQKKVEATKVFVVCLDHAKLDL